MPGMAITYHQPSWRNARMYDLPIMSREAVKLMPSGETATRER